MIDGGKGADQMTGGVGNDTYYMDNINDDAVELMNGGHDSVVSTVALAAEIANIEDYVFNIATGLIFKAGNADNSVAGGSGDDELTGGKGNDRLYGNNGDDRLAGAADNDVLDGGKGKDEMTGGSGNDIYQVNNAKDLGIEAFDDGHDGVYSTVSITALFENVEDLNLVGTGTLNGIGNGLDNRMTGAEGKNTLDGGDGKDVLVGEGGNDILIGGAGADSFNFDLHPKTVNDGHDTIKDFVKAEDVLDFINVGDADSSGAVDLNDLLLVSSVVDHGAGKAVDLVFDNGAIITFAGIGTGAMNSADDLVANAAQIHVA